jgi:hypothetical protein
MAPFLLVTFVCFCVVFKPVSLRRAWAMADEKSAKAIGVDDEWFLFLHGEGSLQPYRSAPTSWPISANELARTEKQAQSGNLILLLVVVFSLQIFAQHCSAQDRSGWDEARLPDVQMWAGAC